MPSKIIIIQISHLIFHNYKIARSIAAQSVENLKQTFKPNITIHVIYNLKESLKRKKSYSIEFIMIQKYLLTV